MTFLTSTTSIAGMVLGEKYGRLVENDMYEIDFRVGDGDGHRELKKTIIAKADYKRGLSEQPVIPDPERALQSRLSLLELNSHLADQGLNIQRTENEFAFMEKRADTTLKPQSLTDNDAYQRNQYMLYLAENLDSNMRDPA